MVQTNSETQFEKDVREGKITDPEKILQYHVDKFNQGGLEKPVKVMPAEAHDREHVSGFFTQKKSVIGRTAKEMEHDLGLQPGSLKNGARIYELTETPKAEQFVPAGYTHMPGGRFFEEGEEYPVGPGAIQFKLNEEVPAKAVGKVNYDQPWTGHSLEAEEKTVDQTLNNAGSGSSSGEQGEAGRTTDQTSTGDSKEFHYSDSAELKDWKQKQAKISELRQQQQESQLEANQRLQKVRENLRQLQREAGLQNEQQPLVPSEESQHIDNNNESTSESEQKSNSSSENHSTTQSNADKGEEHNYGHGL